MNQEENIKKAQEMIEPLRRLIPRFPEEAQKQARDLIDALEGPLVFMHKCKDLLAQQAPVVKLREALDQYVPSQPAKIQEMLESFRSTIPTFPERAQQSAERLSNTLEKQFSDIERQLVSFNAQANIQRSDYRPSSSALGR